MRITYDPNADAMYLYLEDGSVKFKETDELEPGINIDYGVNKNILGIEILDVSKRGPSKDKKPVIEYI